MLQVNHSDLERVKEAILPWLHNKLPVAEVIELPPLSAAVGGGSSRTLFLSPVIQQGTERRTEEWVLRIQATDHQVYQDPSVERQYRIMEVLARCSEVPVPEVLWFESDSQILGAPFFVMKRVAGAVPQAFYHNEGLFPASMPAVRESMWLSAVHALATLHQVDTSSFDFLARPELGSNGLDQELAFWDAYRDWNGVPLTGIQQRSRIWLEEHLPANRFSGLAWGDARLPNMVFQNGHCRAVIDWETASLAGAETDLGWWLFFDWFMTEGSGIPRLEGIPGPETFIATWESFTGRKALDMDWHEVFAILRYTMIRDRALMLFGQQRPADFEKTDPALRRLAKMISA